MRNLFCKWFGHKDFYVVSTSNMTCGRCGVPMPRPSRSVARFGFEHMTGLTNYQLAFLRRFYRFDMPVTSRTIQEYWQKRQQVPSEIIEELKDFGAINSTFERANKEALL